MKQKCIRISLILFLGIQVFSCSSSFEEVGTSIIDPPIEEKILSLEAISLMDVAYGDHPQQKYDIYLPADRTSSKTKVLLLVHGGGWIEGDKSSMTLFIDLIKERYPQHAIVNMNYVLLL